MGATEIILIVLGIVVFILSFVIPARKEKISKDTLKDAKEEIKKIVDEAVKEANSNLEDTAKEISDYNRITIGSIEEMEAFINAVASIISTRRNLP